MFFCSSVSGVCLSLYVPFLLIGCAGSVGISLASWVVYISRVRISPLCGVAGRYNLFGYFGGVGGGTVRIFLSLWLSWLGGSVSFVLSCGKVVKIPSIVRCYPIMSR